jgi:hypothetical protein
MRTELIGVRSTIRPPCGTEIPRTLWPPQRTPISSSRVFAKLIAAATSAGLAQRAITAGRRSTIAFQTCRACW